MPAEIKHNRIPAICRALPAAMHNAVLAIGEHAGGLAQQEAPHETGSLAATVGVDPDSATFSGAGARIVVCAGDISGGYTGSGTRSGGAVDYAMVQEFGGAHTPAHPFMGPAASATASEAPELGVRHLGVAFL